MVKLKIKPEPKAYKRILGVDVSSKSFAFSVYEDGQLVSWGEVHLPGDATKRLVALRKELTALMKQWDQFDAVFMEKAIFVQSTSTASLLSKSAGVTQSVVAENADFHEVTPEEWYKTIGNKRWNKAQKDKFARENPGKAASWYKNQARLARKQYTIDWVKSVFDIEVESDNVADAIGVGHHGVEQNRQA